MLQYKIVFLKKKWRRRHFLHRSKYRKASRQNLLKLQL